MVKLKKSIAALCAAGMFGLSATASAAIIVNDWSVNFNAIGGSFSGYGNISGIDYLNYTGLFNSKTDTVGGTETTNFLINTGTVNGSAGITSTGKVLGATVVGTGIELTGFGQTVGAIVSVNVGPSDTTYTTQNTSGFLKLYAGLPGGAPNGTNGTADTNASSPYRGSGMDGAAGDDPGSVLIATFALVNDGTGSVFSQKLATGATKADFMLVSAIPGLLLDSTGHDLAAGALLSLSDAQTNVDPLSTGGIGNFTIPLGPLAGSCGTTFTNDCGVENGNFKLAVPEPGSLALMGLSLLGLVSTQRRRKS